MVKGKKLEHKQGKEKRYTGGRTIRTTTLVMVLMLGSMAGNVPTVAEETEHGTTVPGGPVLLMAIDPEIGGAHDAHGPISTWAQVVKEGILDQVTNGASGILVIGGSGGDSQIGAFWDEISTIIDEDVSYVDGESEILSQSFEGYAMIAVSSSECELTPRLHPGAGLSNAENEALILRADGIANFVNDGGGLMGFTQATEQPETCPFENPWGYIGQLGDFETITGLAYETIIPTSAGAEVGVSDSLNVCCWHDVFTQWPDFLNVLAWGPGPTETQAAALGGATVVLIPPGAPDAPVNFFADPGPGAGAIQVSWEAPLDDGGAPINEYTIFGADSAEGPFASVGTTANTTFAFTETGLPNNHTRHYQVLATNEAGDSPLSNTANATTFDIPSAPIALDAQQGSGEVTLSWTPPEDDGGLSVTSYNVYAGDQTMSLIGSSTGTGFVEGDLPADDERTYHVTAVNDAGEGPASESITIDLTQTVEIEVNPENENKKVNSRSKGNVRVAVYSTQDFDALAEVDRQSLTFGKTGDEDSLKKCHPKGLDHDGDGLRDLVCHFRIQDTGLSSGDSEAVLKGLLENGQMMLGTTEVQVK